MCVLSVGRQDIAGLLSRSLQDKSIFLTHQLAAHYAAVVNGAGHMSRAAAR